MTVQEIMERTGVSETNLTIAWIKDAINIIQSGYDDNVATWKTNIVEASSSVDNKYSFPANLVKLLSGIRLELGVLGGMVKDREVLRQWENFLRIWPFRE